MCKGCRDAWTGAKCDSCGPRHALGASGSCNRCAIGRTNYPLCECRNSFTGENCDVCPEAFAGELCDRCAFGRMGYPTCGLYVCTPWLSNADKTFQYLQSGYVFPQEELRNWADAEARCVQLGGHLASVESEEENNFIFDINPQADKARWLGGFRTRAEPEAIDPVPYNWSWSDSSSFDVFDSVTPRPGVCGKSDAYKCLFPQDAALGAEPNDLQGREDCLSMGHRAASMRGNWNDEWCETKMQFVCKRPFRSDTLRCGPVPFKISGFRERLFNRVLEAQDPE